MDLDLWGMKLGRGGTMFPSSVGFGLIGLCLSGGNSVKDPTYDRNVDFANGIDVLDVLFGTAGLGGAAPSLGRSLTTAVLSPERD